MSEWLKEHAWKACVGETLPRVRIPLSPPIFLTCGSVGWRLARAYRASRDSLSLIAALVRASCGRSRALGRGRWPDAPARARLGSRAPDTRPARRARASERRAGRTREHDASIACLPVATDLRQRVPQRHVTRCDDSERAVCWNLAPSGSVSGVLIPEVPFPNIIAGASSRRDTSTRRRCPRGYAGRIVSTAPLPAPARAAHQGLRCAPPRAR